MTEKAPRLEPKFKKAQIEERIRSMAVAINQAYGDEPLIAVCVLKGAFVFFADLVRALDRPAMELDFVRLASYGRGTDPGHIRFGKDVELDIRRKHVLIVEDIVDSGRTMRFLLKQFAARDPASIDIAALVDKKERREQDIKVRFSCFELGAGFLVGYGLDYDEKYRSLPDICELVFQD